MNPITTTFIVNTQRLGDQLYPFVKINQTDNSFVVSWAGNQNGTYDIFAKKIDLNIINTSIVALTPEILVNVNINNPSATTTLGRQITPKIAFHYPSDEIIIAWRDDDAQDGSGLGVFARVINNTIFTLVVDQFRINNQTNDHQILSDIGVSPVTGELITICNSLGYVQEYDVILRKFTRNGSGNWIGGNETVVNSYTSDWQWAPSLLINNTTGEYIISWTSDYQDGSGRGAYSAIFDKDNLVVKPEFRVSLPSLENQFFEKQVWDEATRNIVYFYSYSSGSFATIKYQIYDSNFNPVGIETAALDQNGTELNTSGLNNFFYLSYSETSQKLTLGYSVYQSFFSSNSKTYFRQFKFVRPCAIPTFNVGADATICNGESIQIGTSEIQNVTYSWLPTAGLNDATIPNPIASPSITTEYIVTATCQGGSFVESDTIIISVTPKPIKPENWANGHTTFCSGESVTLQAGTSEQGVDYQWYHNDVVIPGATTEKYIFNYAGLFKVKTTKNGCTSDDSEQIEVTIGAACATIPQIPSFSINPIEPKLIGESLPRPMYVYDRFGDSTLLDNIEIPSNSVVAGIFRLHFEDEDVNNNIGFDDPILGLNRRNVIVQVFRDVSRLLSTTGDIFGLPNPYPALMRPFAEINIKSGPITGQPTALGSATQYYLEAGQGITYGELWELINTGFNPYHGLANTPLTPVNGFFHGYAQFDLTNYSWYTVLNSATPSAGQYDLYSVALHEVLHALGIASKINPVGNSFIIQYAFYDTYLTKSGGNPLLIDPSNQNCYNFSVDGTISDITAGCNSVFFNGTNLINHEVYSPSIYNAGSSLSHLNCSHIPGYVMNASGPSQYVQRTPHLYEVKLLCDLGYQITSQYGTGVYATSTNTYINACSYIGTRNPIKIAGVNDFKPYQFSNIQSPYSVDAGSSLVITKANIINNDIGPIGTPVDGTITMSCLEIISGAGILTSVTSTGFTYNAPNWYYGHTVLRYRPVNQYGNIGNNTYIFINVNPQSPPPCAAVTNCNLLGCDGALEIFPNANFIFQTAGNSVDFVTNDIHPVLSFFPNTNGGRVWDANSTCDGQSWANPLPQEGLHYIGITASIPSTNPYSEGFSIPINPASGTTTLLPGRKYRISFWAQSLSSQNCPPTFSVYLSDNPPCTPPGNWTSCGSFVPTLIGDVPINNTPNVWTQYFIDYIPPVGSFFDNLIIVNNGNFIPTIPNYPYRYGFIDNIIIEEVPIVNVTSLIGNGIKCVNNNFDISYTVCLESNYNTNANPITLTVNPSLGLQLGTGGNFNSLGQVTIPANTLTAASRCTTLLLNLNVLNNAPINVPISTILSVSDGVCDQNPQRKIDQVTISAPPSVNAGTDVAICLGNNAPIGMAPEPGVTYSWTPSNGLSNPSLSNPIATPTTTTTYRLTASIGNSCSTSDDIVVSVNTPVVDFNTTSTLCTMNGIRFNDLSTNVLPGAVYTWNFGISVDAVPTSFVGATPPPVQFVLVGTKTISLTINNGTCSATKNLTIQIASCGSECGKGPFVETIGTFNTNTYFDLAGGTRVFSGNVRVRGNIYFSNGTVRLTSGTVMYMDGLPEYTTPFCNGGSIHLDNITFRMNGAKITSICDEMWCGIFAINSRITTDQQGSTPSEISYSFIGLNIEQSPRTQISSTNFLNNYYQSVWLKAPLGTNHSIANSTFSSNPIQMKYPYQKVNNYLQYYNQRAIFVEGNTTVSIDGNTFDGLNYGVWNRLEGTFPTQTGILTIANNTFRNNYGSGIFALYNDVVRNNTITVPSNSFNTPQINSLWDVAGVFAQGSVSIIRNTIQSDIANPFASPKRQVGIGNYQQLDRPIIRNDIRAMDIGLYGIHNSGGATSSNNFLNNGTAIYYSPFPYNIALGGVITCNTFNNSTLTGGTSMGIYVSPNTFLNNLGSPSSPNGNSFTGTNPLVHDGIGYNAFRYYRYNSTQENIQVKSFLNTPPTNLFANVNTGLSANNGTCPGAPGINMKISADGDDVFGKPEKPLPVSNETLFAIKDSLRFQLGNFEKMKQWQYEIALYHEENKKLDDLAAYAEELKGCNKEAYNSILLHLMEQYHQQGYCNKGHQCKNLVKNYNTGDVELDARTKYFDYQCRQSHRTPTYKSIPNIPDISKQDSTDLLTIAASGTSYSELACMQLRTHNIKGICNLTSSYSPVYPDCNEACARSRTAFLMKGKDKSKEVNRNKIGGQLGQNVPNPAENSTTIPYVIPVEETTNIESAYIVIQNIVNGNEVKKIKLETMGHSSIQISLEGLRSGVYSYSLIVNGINQDIKKMIVIK